MLQNSIKFLLLSFLITNCFLNSNNQGSPQKVFYTDRGNPHAKMQLPLEISWTHDKAGKPNQPISVTIVARALSDLTNAKINLTLSPSLNLIGGETVKSISSLTSGTSSELNLTVSPVKPGSYDINVLLNANLNGESIGTARTIRFETSDFVAEKPQENPSGLRIIEGRTDNKK